MVFPLSADGGGTATEVAAVVVASFGLSASLDCPSADCPSGAVVVAVDVVVDLPPNKLVTGAAGAVVVEEVFFAPNKLAGGVDAAGVVVAVVAGFRPKRPVVGNVLASFLSDEVSLFPKRLNAGVVEDCISLPTQRDLRQL